jgi:threonine/homoserine/homoserine lactone efflux protein
MRTHITTPQPTKTIVARLALESDMRMGNAYLVGIDAGLKLMVLTAILGQSGSHQYSFQGCNMTLTTGLDAVFVL